MVLPLLAAIFQYSHLKKAVLQFFKLLFALPISKVAAQVAMATQFFKDPTQDHSSTFYSLNHFTYHFGFTKALLANDAILQGQCYMMNIEVEVYVYLNFNDFCMLQFYSFIIRVRISIKINRGHSLIIVYFFLHLNTTDIFFYFWCFHLSYGLVEM